MTLLMRDQENIDKGREQGLEEGRKEGLQEGLKQGIEQGGGPYYGTYAETPSR
ncbi:MAG: hypothetical protein ACLVK1_02630 [Lachnospiraceae bacterium]